MDAALPGLTCVLTAKQADICIGDELALAMKRIEMDAVIRRDIKARRGPLRARHSPRIFCGPVFAAVGGRQRAPEIRSIGEIRILIRHAEHQRVFSPSRAKRLRDPRVVHVGREGLAFFPHQLPGVSSIDGFRNAVPGCAAELEVTIRDVGRLRMVQARRDRPHSRAVTG